MARINLYNANSLADQAVGTPGIDPTGETLMNIGSTITNATNTYIKAEAEKLDIANNIQAEVEKIKYESELYRTIEEQKQIKENMDNPYDYADTVYSTAELAAEEYAKGITNPQVKQRFEQKVATIPASAQKSATKWASDQTVTNTFISVKEGLDHITMQAKNMTDLNGFNGCLAQGEALIANSVGVLGPEKAYALRQQMRKDIAGNFIYSKIDTAPSTVKSYLESGNFDGIYDEKEKLSISRTCETIGKRNARDISNANILGNSQEFQNLASGIRQGVPDIMTLENKLVSLKQAGVRTNSKEYQKWLALRDAAVQGKFTEYTDTDARKALLKVTNMLGSSSVSATEELAGRGVKGLSLNKLEEMDNVLELNAHLLSSKEYNNYRHALDTLWTKYTKGNRYAAKGNNAIERRWNKVIQAPADDFNSGLKMGYNAINARYKDDKETRDQVKVDFARAYNKYYQSSWNYDKTIFDYKKFTEDMLNQLYARY